jgi:hypothetical protein
LSGLHFRSHFFTNVPILQNSKITGITEFSWRFQQNDVVPDRQHCCRIYRHLFLFLLFQLVSGVPAGLGEVGVVQAKSRIYILLHGAFMIGAWICAASLGIILAR